MLNSSCEDRVPRAQICSRTDSGHLRFSECVWDPLWREFEKHRKWYKQQNAESGQEKRSRSCWRNQWTQTGEPLTRGGKVGMSKQETKLSAPIKGLTFAYLAEKRVASYALVCGSLRTPYVNLGKFLYLAVCFCTEERASFSLLQQGCGVTAVRAPGKGAEAIRKAAQRHQLIKSGRGCVIPAATLKQALLPAQGRGQRMGLVHKEGLWQQRELHESKWRNKTAVSCIQAPLWEGINI